MARRGPSSTTEVIGQITNSSPVISQSLPGLKAIADGEVAAIVLVIVTVLRVLGIKLKVSILGRWSGEQVGRLVRTLTAEFHIINKSHIVAAKPKGTLNIGIGFSEHNDSLLMFQALQLARLRNLAKSLFPDSKDSLTW